MRSVLGTILDPAADKMLMTTLTVTLAMKDLIPSSYRSLVSITLITDFISVVPLAVIILGRDVLLSLSAFYIRYTSLPQPVRSFMTTSVIAIMFAFPRKPSLDIGTSQYPLLKCALLELAKCVRPDFN